VTKLFDPETGAVKDPRALKSVQFAGARPTLKPAVVDGKKVTPWLNENTGTFGGTTTEHDSGRVDVNVQAQAVKASTST